MNLERDKFLTEAMGEVYYSRESRVSQSWGYASDFSTWEGFGKLWTWVKTQDIWYNISEILGQSDSHCLINPEELANTVYEMLKDKQ